MAYNIPASPAYKVTGLAHEWRASDVTTGDTTWVDRRGGVELTITNSGTESFTLDNTGIVCPANYVRKTTLDAVAEGTTITSGYLLSPATGQISLYVCSARFWQTASTVNIGDTTSGGGVGIRPTLAGSKIIASSGNDHNLQASTNVPDWTGTLAYLFDHTNNTSTKYQYETTGVQTDALTGATVTGTLAGFSLDTDQSMNLVLDGDGSANEDAFAGIYIYYFDALPSDLTTGLSWMAANPTSGAYIFTG